MLNTFQESERIGGETVEGTKRSGQRWKLRCQRKLSDQVKVKENSQAGESAQ